MVSSHHKYAKAELFHANDQAQLDAFASPLLSFLRNFHLQRPQKPRSLMTHILPCTQSHPQPGTFKCQHDDLLYLVEAKEARSSMMLTCLCLTHNLTHHLELY